MRPHVTAESPRGQGGDGDGWSLARGKNQPAAKYAAFISHYKMEAAMEARFVKMELEHALGAPVFLDSDDLRNLNQLQACVLASQVLVIVQSSGVYKRPYVLLELCTAIAYHIPIVAVQLCGGPFAYDFGDSAEFLMHLDQRLSTSEAKVLRDHGVSLIDCAWKLSEIIPFVISTRLDPGFSRAVLSAVISDLIEAIRNAQPPLVVAPQARLEPNAQRPAAGSSDRSRCHSLLYAVRARPAATRSSGRGPPVLLDTACGRG